MLISPPLPRLPHDLPRSGLEKGEAALRRRSGWLVGGLFTVGGGVRNWGWSDRLEVVARPTHKLLRHSTGKIPPRPQTPPHNLFQIVSIKTNKMPLCIHIYNFCLHTLPAPNVFWIISIKTNWWMVLYILLSIFVKQVTICNLIKDYPPATLY